MEMEKEIGKGSTHHFVLVHGAQHGAWCWYKLRRRLESVGHKVTCLDMAGSGIDFSNQINSFEDYNRPLMNFISNLPGDEKVILVGHSFGGFCVTQAMYQFPGKISLVIYVVAVLAFSTIKLKNNAEKEENQNFIQAFHLGGGEDVKSRFYNLSPYEDCALASMLLRPFPLSPSLSSLPKLEGDGVDKVRRVYVRTGCDHAISPLLQDVMTMVWPPDQVLRIDSDHSPFFSMPDQLFDLIVQASAATDVY